MSSVNKVIDSPTRSASARAVRWPPLSRSRKPNADNRLPTMSTRNSPTTTRMDTLPGRFRKFSVLALPLLAGAATVLLTVQLGNWQLRRAAEKSALQQAIEQRSAQAPAALGQDDPPEWAPLALRGEWHP